PRVKRRSQSWAALLADEDNLKVRSTMLSNDRRLLDHLGELDEQEQTYILAQLGEDEALRDVGAHLTIDKVRDVLEYAPTTRLARQIRAALARALQRTDQNPSVSRP